MKRLLLVLTVSMIFASFGYAQQKNDLRGPQAKNYKSWKYKSEKKAVVAKVSGKKLTGPQAKNKKSLRADEAEYTAVTSGKRPKVTGPKAKNWKLMPPEAANTDDGTDIASDEPKRPADKNRKVEMDKDNR
ncbi:hypothetical protein [Flavilitoribacter nigricans]|uniref:Uncharacterized protein n=1 Tax=Flavilitoribacter nigricans (strain ATCC 23147 / DSM 23189 / NBRC 102662 / NCIMB 1420 / SS-2) TaxID=1122177 RepID=A0A2D0N1Q7_FLAN2|nr:hypothetical protein [Flavilitoribacter nigricans]PHN02397.1 hypothetical protein CRP01_31950 [Flavilitoribacter nigricans DSM 23189 = NBRC 102662]